MQLRIRNARNRRGSRVARAVECGASMANVTTVQPTSSSIPRLALAGWFAFATLLAAVAPLSRAPFLVPLAVFGTILGGVLLYRRSSTIRAAVQRLDTRTLLAVHLVRAPIGIMFLFMYAAGSLPAIFAVRAGIGDTLAGLTALLLVLAVPTAALSKRHRKYLFAWNTLGLIDIAMSVGTGQKVLLLDRDPIAIATVQAFPLPLIPFFVVPAVVLTHLAIYARLRTLTSSS